jgi:hypothetical protein
MGMIGRYLRALRTLYSYPFKRELITGIEQGWFPVFIRYPVYPKPRYGYNGNKPHPFLYEIINRRRDAYKVQLMVLKAYEDYLLRIKTNRPDDVEQPYWSNRWFSGLDAVALYGFIATAKPKLYLEIGSGNSTKFAKRAISDHKLSTKIVSVDPHPREEIDSLSDEIIRRPLEETDLGLFDSLTKNDILFFDGSHRCFMNSDVTVFFLEVLPKLPPGILIHLHDIHLPYDYPPERALHYESEQYLLATMLLGGCTKYEIVLPNKFILSDQSLTSCLQGLWDSKETNISQEGSSFWFRKR